MVRKLLSLFVALMIAVSPVLLEAKSNRGIYRTYKSELVRTSPKSTYKIGGTKYNANERYKTSGLPKVKRSESAKKRFLKSKGYKRVPPGYEVDHIIPLSKGGKDEPSNMQLIPKSVYKQKTAGERKK
jgi:hypothetical protein